MTSHAQAAFLLIMPTANDAPIFAVPENADTAIRVLQALRAERMIWLYAYAVLPDHVRVLLRPEGGCALKEILKSLRGGIARGLATRGVQGPVWMPRSEIRKLWNGDLIRTVAKEVDSAPATAGITPNPESFAYCSANPEAEVDNLDAETATPLSAPLARPAVRA